VLVVDDEPPARRRLRRMLERIPDVSVCGEAADGVEALERIAALSPDLVLLDVRMPGLDGIELASRGAGLPPIVFTTAYDEYALRAFDVAAVDYLLKPVRAERLRAAVVRGRERAQPGAPDLARVRELLARLARPDAVRPLAARAGSVVRFVDPREVTRIEAADRYAVIRHGGAELVLDESLAALEERLREYGFVRTHRGELVNSHHVRALRDSPDGVVIELSDGQHARASRRLAPELRRRLGLD
jgi:DNA-binding LytR/AlgR family response regulator